MPIFKDFGLFGGDSNIIILLVEKMKDLLNDKSSRDLILVLFFTILGTFLLAKIEAFELFFDVTRKYEVLELDEILLGILILVIGMIWFSYRRWSENVLFCRQLKTTEKELINSNIELDSRVKD